MIHTNNISPGYSTLHVLLGMHLVYHRNILWAD